MASGRSLELLFGQILTDFSYTHNTTYTTVLCRDQLQAATRVTAVDDIPLGTTYGSGLTKNFIFPFLYNYNTVLDGIARGNINVGMHMEAGDAEPTVITIYAVISLKSITTGGVATTLGTVTTAEVSQTGYAFDLNVDIPFFMNLNNVSVVAADRMILSVVYYAKYSAWYTGAKWARAYFALNSNNVFIELPRVID